MARITERILQMQVDTLNHTMGESLTPCTNHGGNNFEWHIGAYVVCPQNGCVELHQIQTDGGGVEVIFDGRTKRELFDSIRAYIDGYHDAKCVAETPTPKCEPLGDADWHCSACGIAMTGTEPPTSWCPECDDPQ